MADWRQIQARIRKAKASTDAAAQLAELYERTRDAMVAFELARFQEKAGEHAEAARWYTAAAERFRRSQWKTKAEAALARLRAPATAGAEPSQEVGAPQDISATTNSRSAGDSESAEFQPTSERFDLPQAQDEAGISADVKNKPSEIAAEPGQRATTSRDAAEKVAMQGTAPGRRPPRHRGRRGGRNRRRPAKVSAGAAVGPAVIQAQEPTAIDEPKRVSPISAQPVPESRAPIETPTGDVVSPTVARRGVSRAGEPALASRMAHLESQLRRMLSCPQAKLDQADSAPAGPGVLLLSDSDQVTHYYIESCQTLRIAIGNLVRGGRGAKDLPQLKERLAENLGIAESRVAAYLREHCAVRWLQLDEGASELAHFAIAVLRPVVNE
jgi:hypothetical protein